MRGDIRVLREIAAKYYAYASSDENYEKMELHRASNDMKSGTRPVVLLNEIPWNEFTGFEALTPVCEDPVLRGIEMQMRQAIFQKEHFPADMVIQPFIGIQKIVMTEGPRGPVPVYTEIDRKSENQVQSHQYATVFHSLEDVEQIQPGRLIYDRHATMRLYERIADAIGDIVPVKVTGMYAVMGIAHMPWDSLARLMSMDDLLFNMYDNPELMHALIGRFTDVFLDRMRQYEELGLLEGDSFDLHCTPALSNDLKPDRDNVKLSQVWGRAAAQILGVVSPEMTDEFEIAYQMRAMKPFGLVYYGCCEPLDRKIDIVEKIPNLRKITVTPWADVNRAIEAINGRFVVSAKANPGLVSEASGLNMEAVTREIETIVDACHRYHCTCDLVLKDISTVGGRIENLVEWEQAAMRLAAKYEP